MNAEQFAGLLAARGSKVVRTANGWQAQCPAHDDHNPSLAIAIGDGGRVLLTCHASCQTEAICLALNLTLADLFPDGAKPRVAGASSEIAEIYPYRDESGRVLFEAVRFVPKGFRQRIPDPAHPGRHIWSLNGVRRVIFRLPEVLKAIQARQTVFVAEGEKDVLALVKHGFCATCNSEGARKWKPGHSQSLRGATVVIIADKDKPGREHADLVARSLQGLATAIKVIELPDLGVSPVKDAHDFFEAGGTAEMLNEIAAQAPPFNPASAADVPMTADGTTKADPPRDAPLDWQGLFDFKPEEDADCLLGRRWLGKSGSCIWVGQSGIGKSTLNIQAAILWALGKPFFGIAPRRPLRSAIIQAENDFGDVAEMIQGVARGLGLPVNQLPLNRVRIYRLAGVNGLEFIGRAERIVEHERADLLWVDPLLEYFGEDVNKQKEAAEFCSHLTAMQARTGVCTMLVHHTGKPRETKAQAGWTTTDYSYIGLGSSVLTNWARAVVVLQQMREEHDIYSLTFAKRGKRTGIRSEDGEPLTQVYLEHARQGLFWEASDYQKPGDKGGRPEEFPLEAIAQNMPLTPPQKPAGCKNWIRGFCGCSETTARNKYFEMMGVYITLDGNGFVQKRENCNNVQKPAITGFYTPPAITAQSPLGDGR